MHAAFIILYNAIVIKELEISSSVSLPGRSNTSNISSYWERKKHEVYKFTFYFKFYKYGKRWVVDHSTTRWFPVHNNDHVAPCIVVPVHFSSASKCAGDDKLWRERLHSLSSTTNCVETHTLFVILLTTNIHRNRNLVAQFVVPASLRILHFRFVAPYHGPISWPHIVAPYHEWLYRVIVHWNFHSPKQKYSYWCYLQTPKFQSKRVSNAVVTPLRKAASYEPRIAILGIWGDTWLTRGKYGIYVAVRGSYEALTGSTWRLLESGKKFQNVQNSAT